MFDWFPYRLSFVRRPAVDPPTRVLPGRAGPRLALIVGAAALAMTGVPAVQAAADTSGSSALTINTVTLSITVAPATGAFGFCLNGNSTATQLGFPNGECYAPVDANNQVQRITITNTGGSGHVRVQGSNAVPNAGSGSWTLCSPVGGALPACGGGPGLAGRDQFLLATVHPDASFGNSGTTGVYLTSELVCDSGINGATATDPCALASAASAQEFLILGGPSATTNPSATFTTTVTWIIGL